MAREVHNKFTPPAREKSIGAINEIRQIFSNFIGNLLGVNIGEIKEFFKHRGDCTCIE